MCAVKWPLRVHRRLRGSFGDGVTRKLGAGRWALGAGRWALGAGRWALGAGRWANPAVIPRSAATRGLLRQAPKSESRSFASLRMTTGRFQDDNRAGCRLPTTVDSRLSTLA